LNCDEKRQDAFDSYANSLMQYPLPGRQKWQISMAIVIGLTCYIFVPMFGALPFLCFKE